MNKKVSRIILFILTLITVVLLFFLLRNQIFEILKLAKNNEKDQIREVIKNRGVFGLIMVVLIEAIQMVVVVIPAEFIQLSAGISYNFAIASVLCLLGVFLGATTIYILVNVLKFDESIFSKSNKKISLMLKQKKENVTTQVLMYLLFIMPIIPFGAICYFGSSSKISYRRYILTCVTGVIPSIISSIIMGNALVYFTATGTSIWLLVLIIIGLAAILFGGVYIIIKKYFFNKNEFCPNPIYYGLFYNLFKIFVGFKTKIKVENENIFSLDGPTLYLANHQSFYDFYYTCHFIYPFKAVMVGNRYYFRFPFIRFLMNKIHAIPKRLFYPDIETIKLIIKNIRANQNVIMFPEGRLSCDGSSYQISDGLGELIKKIKCNVVVMGINGAFYTKPKWSKKFSRGTVSLYEKKIYTKDDILNIDAITLQNEINQLIQTNENEFILEHNLKYRNNKKAIGLENQLYYCPHCHQLYTINTNDNIIECSNCHYKVEIQKDYSFKELSFYNMNIQNLIEWNSKQCEYENLKLISNDYQLKAEVDIVNLNLENKKNDLHGSGLCTLNADCFSFEGVVDNKPLAFSIPCKQLKALAYSCNEEFECYYENELYYFYPKENKKQVVQWATFVDVINRIK